MIFYLVTADDRHGLVRYLAGKEGEPQVSVVTYARACGSRQLPRGTYIFADLDRLRPREAERAAELWRALASGSPGIRLVNHPTRAMRWYELLRHLHERGVNPFDVYRWSEVRLPRRFPVFLRVGAGHGTADPPLLRTPDELVAALAREDRLGRSREAITIVESCDTPDGAGRRHTYRALVVGARIVPWRVVVRGVGDGALGGGSAPKHADLTGAYLEQNPHAQALAEICTAARVEWGLLEYGIFDDHLVVWHLDADPELVVGDAAWAEVDAVRTRLLRDALAALESPPMATPAWITTGLPPGGSLRTVGRRAVASLQERMKALSDRLPRRAPPPRGSLGEEG